MITSFRLLLLIPLSYYLYNENYSISLYLFIIAGISDVFDGFLAKKYHWTSHFGSILDPLADKLLLMVSLAFLTWYQKIYFILFVMSSLRDIYIIIGAYLCYKRFGQYKMKPSLYSKINTFFQIIMVTLVLISLGYYPLSPLLFIVLKWVVLSSLLISTVHYSWVWGRWYFSHHPSKKTT
jgi:cardiolipin synthase